MKLNLIPTKCKEYDNAAGITFLIRNQETIEFLYPGKS